MDTMRDRFAAVTSGLLDTDPRIAVVLAAITADGFAAARARHPGRVIDLGIREQLLISVAGGLALAGLRPIAHTFASFLVERPFEQIKLDLNHQRTGAVLVSSGASVDYSAAGRTHQSPGDVALLGTLPGWTVHIPGHPDEAEAQLRAAASGSGLVYVRLSALANSAPLASPASLAGGAGRFTVLRRGGRGTVIATGPMADPVLAATDGMDVTVLYAPTVRPFDRHTLRATLAAPVVVTVEPYLAGTSAAEVAAALADVPHRALSLGVPREELRKYGTPQQHLAAHGLDPGSLRDRIAAFVAASPVHGHPDGRRPARAPV